MLVANETTVRKGFFDKTCGMKLYTGKVCLMCQTCSYTGPSRSKTQVCRMSSPTKTCDIFYFPRVILCLQVRVDTCFFFFLKGNLRKFSKSCSTWYPLPIVIPEIVPRRKFIWQEKQSNLIWFDLTSLFFIGNKHTNGYNNDQNERYKKIHSQAHLSHKTYGEKCKWRKKTLQWVLYIKRMITSQKRNAMKQR